MENILRSFGAVIDDVDASERSIVAKISTGELDRYRTVIKSNGVDFANYRKNPIVLFEHGKSPVRGSVPIGKNVWIKQDGVGNGRILAKTRFAEDEFSDLLFSFYKDETMRGWSVSILPSDAGAPTREEVRSRPELKDCELVYRTSELLEYSCVSVPGAAGALTDPELRSLSTLVVRGFWQPTEDVKPLVEPIVAELSATASEGEPAEEAGAEGVDRSTDDLLEIAEDVAAVDRDGAAPETTAERVHRDPSYYWNVFCEAATRRGMKPDEIGRLMTEQLDLLDQERRSHPDDAEPAADPEPEHTPEPEPEPVDPLAGLPPLVARSLIDVMTEHSRMIRDWREQNRAMIREVVELLRGKA